MVAASLMIFSTSSLNPTRGICSRVSKHTFAGRVFHVKRDDENSIQGLSVNGNKSRKLFWLSNMQPFPSLVASYGGSQSNSMLAVAKITAASPGSTFVYFTKPLPKFLRNVPSGNLKAALALGMQVQVTTRGEYFYNLTKLLFPLLSFPLDISYFFYSFSAY